MNFRMYRIVQQSFAKIGSRTSKNLWTEKEMIIFYSPTSGRATKLNTQSEKEKNNITNNNMTKLECGPMPNVMVALPLFNAAKCRAVTLPRCESR